MASTVKIHIKGVAELAAKYANLRRNANNANVYVGYTAAYAMATHEAVGRQWKRPGAEAKYLEKPFRQSKDRVVEIVRSAFMNGASLEHGLYIGGLYIQRKSQELVPVDTGFLRASAFTRSREFEFKHTHPPTE